MSVYRHERRRLEFDNALEKRRKTNVGIVDPTDALLTQIRNTPLDRQADALFPDGAFLNLENPQAATETVKKWLRDILADGRTHYDIALDLNVDQRHLHPIPWYAALTRISQVEGWFFECFSGALDSNLGFLEHPETYCTHSAAVEHKVTCNQAAMLSLSSSSRKTGMKEFCDSLVFDAEGAPDDIKSRAVLLADSTKKGIETMLWNYKRVLLSSSELANTLFIDGFSDPKSGINFISKTRLCEWILSETVASATGHCIPRENWGPRDFMCSARAYRWGGQSKTASVLGLVPV